MRVQFLRLGREGYTKIMQNLGLVAKRLQKGIEDTGAPTSPVLHPAFHACLPSWQCRLCNVCTGIC